jgi:hypothetical protein
MVYSVGPTFGPRPRPAWIGPAADVAHGAQADGTRPGVRTAVIVHRPLVAARSALAHRRRFLGEVFTMRMRTMSGWRREPLHGRGLTRSVRRRRDDPGQQSRLVMRGSSDR